ncbi:acyltransferase [Pedobacter sp. B4-66]|uniref:acyltransferase family protein n=1 Tax=Pedobacter sp. B4-66 TaxID=2817280 RepID=UPI001BDB62A3|nr:acyltransferase [Pedobacter sp. B4-66]
MEKPIYFKGLTELRGIAAVAVMFHHIELYKYRVGELSLFQNRYIKPFISGLGKNGVYLFFVLSGFLITYLLLQEKKATNTIKIRKFYVRRILRIWPLYYIILVISFFILPITLGHTFWGNEIDYQTRISQLEYGGNLTLFIFFLSNLALIIFPPVVGAAQSWSVSVEEQFYLFWPLLVKFYHKNLPFMLIIIAIGKPIALYILAKGAKKMGYDIAISLRFLDSLKIEFMAMGGLLSWVLINKKKQFEKIFSSNILIYFVSVILTGALLTNSLPYLNAILFMLILGYIVRNGFENKIFKKLGEVSYGIYMYHPIIMYLAFAFVHSFLAKTGSMITLIAEYLLVFLLTYLVSILSYNYIEEYFLKLKSKFAIIHSKNK